MPWRKLVDEAERTVVVTRSNLVKDSRLHFDAQRLSRCLLDFDGAVQAAPIHFDAEIFLISQHLILDDVT